jgi:hypothetical protein
MQRRRVWGRVPPLVRAMLLALRARMPCIADRRGATARTRCGTGDLGPIVRIELDLHSPRCAGLRSLLPALRRFNVNSMPRACSN